MTLKILITNIIDAINVIIPDSIINGIIISESFRCPGTDTLRRIASAPAPQSQYRWWQRTQHIRSLGL